MRQYFMEDLERELLNRAFLKKYNFKRRIIDEFLMSRETEWAINRLFDTKCFNAKQTLDLIRPLVNHFYKDEPPEDWLVYFYQYSLYMAFPNAITIPLDRKKNRIAEIFLRAYHVVCQYQKASDDGTWQSAYPMTFLTEEEISDLEDEREYRAFQQHFENEYAYEMMKLNQEVIGYSTLDHICGVYFLAMKVARQLKRAGYPIDLGRVAGAAAGHDIGKFGCKPDEMKRVAYYHYFYTGEWFEKRGIVYIRNVAINHSTWDLELEALPIESLILIYSDFRVKANQDRQMTIFDLQDSFNVILDKLDNVDEAKENRYRNVYRYLKDFENFLLDCQIDVSSDRSHPMLIEEGHPKKYFSLMQGDEITQNVIYASIEHNISVLYRLRDEASLNKILEPVRNSRNMTKLRGYISVLEEYTNYMTQKQKQIIMNFLYEKLVLPEEDIRKQCAELLGMLIANYDEEIRKEVPPSAKVHHEELDTVSLFERYVDRCLFPESKIISRHKKYISYSLRDMVASYFEHLEASAKRQESIEILVSYFKAFNHEEQTRFYLIKAARVLPFSEFDANQLYIVFNFVADLLDCPDVKLRLRAYNLIYSILPYINESLIEKTNVRRVFRLEDMNTEDPAENYARLKLAESLKCEAHIIEALKQISLNDLQYTSNIYLSNLKSATLDVAKRFQIELLMRNTLLYDYENCFYMAMHLCNLLKVSALESVRNTAGRMLLQIIPHLTYEQKNDITVELLRALEMESYEFTKYIPPYLGQIIMHIKPKELDEILESFEQKMCTNHEKLIALIEKTLGYAIRNYSNYRYAFKDTADNHDKRFMRMFGILFKGFVHASHHVNQMAFSVIAKDIFTDQVLSLNKKEYIYKRTVKKLMTLMINTDEDVDLIFYNNAACLKYIYRFINTFLHEEGSIDLKPNNRIAFFPGAFDPFTVSHKQIANDINKRGFEVLLYVDEFSWSKRTQPNMIRRNIIKKSVADEVGIYTFPRDISVNLANNQDLEKLVDLFPDSEVYLVVGSDVVMNASAYKNSEDSVIKHIPHVIYERGGMVYPEDEQKLLDSKMKQLHPRTVRLTLPKEYENISSTLIRDYIDEKRDIASLIDPLAQNYIYEKGLYQREPMYKSVIKTKSLVLSMIEEPSDRLLGELALLMGDKHEKHFKVLKEVSSRLNARILILRSLENDNQIVGYSLFHWLRASNIHHEFSDPSIISYIRNESVGRILVIDSIIRKKDSDVKNIDQIMLTETLAYALARDYTYCVYNESVKTQVSTTINEVLVNQGFINISSMKTYENTYAVDMSSPCTVNLDIQSMFKEPYKNHPQVIKIMIETRRKLQTALTKLYPGNLVLHFDREMIHETLIKKVCDENRMPVVPIVPKQTGDNMCVPFGAVFKRMLLPNTVTKTLHAEKYFLPDLSEHQIKEYPFYLDINNQIKMIKSFNRPVILVDDLLNKGYRIKALEPYFKEEDVQIKKFIVGIMSGSGKEIAESMNYNVDAAYFIPKIKVWFYESKLYPFIDGDAVWRGSIPESNLINSINLLLPYASASYIKGASREAIYHLSEVALENAIEIMTAVETAYENHNDRLLTIDRLGEVLNTPRYPDKGKNIFYSNNVKPSEYIKDDREQLKKLKAFYMGS